MPSEREEEKETEYMKLKYEQWIICPKCKKRYKASDGHKCHEEE